MNVLITGGSGFIGQHLINSLLLYPGVEKIFNIDIKDCMIKDPKVKHINCNILHPINLDISDEVSICIHLAALCKEPGFEWEEYFNTNHIGTVNVIDYCTKKGIKKILFTSTMMVFKAGEKQMQEHDTTCPDTAYGISKLLAEKELAKWAHGNSNWYKVIRPAVVFGENENGNFTRMFKAIRKGFFPFVGRKNTVKSNIYVKEVVLFIIFLITQNTKSKIYNFAFPEESKMDHIVACFKKVFSLRSFNPVLPYKFLMLISYCFELLNGIGFRNSIHHRRIQKLFYSTNIYPRNALNDGYEFKFNLTSSLEDWKAIDNKLFVENS